MAYKNKILKNKGNTPNQIFSQFMINTVFASLWNILKSQYRAAGWIKLSVRKTWVSAQRQAGRASAFLDVFRPSADWVWPTHAREGQSASLGLPIQVLISSGTILSDIHRIMFDQMSRNPMAQPRWYLKVTITGYNNISSLYKVKTGAKWIYYVTIKVGRVATC